MDTKTDPINVLINGDNLSESKKTKPKISEVVFTENEISIYEIYKYKCKFPNPEKEFEWAKTQIKTCSKCNEEKKLCDFNGNTSGRDPFNKQGYRLRRPECKKCTKGVGKGKTEAKKKAKDLGIPFVAPNGSICGVCGKSASSGNGLVFDHCHEKNIFRGYCCNSCNRSIGVLGDNIDGILKVLNYLKKTDDRDIIQNEKGEFVVV
jgi:hypothetical protein